MTISLAEAKKVNGGEAQLFSTLMMYAQDGSIDRAARGGFDPEVHAWFNAKKSGQTVQGASDMAVKESQAILGSGNFNAQGLTPAEVSQNTTADVAYQQRLGAMGGSAGVVTPPHITTDSIQAGLKALTDKISKEGITDSTGKVLLAPGSSYNASTGTMGAISSSSLQGGTQPLTIATSTSNSSLADSTAAGAEATNKSIDAYMKLYAGPETETSKTASSLIQQINTELESLKGRGTAQLSEEEKQGVAQKKQLLQNEQTNLQTKLAEYKAIQSKYQALNTDIEGKPITMNSIIGSQAQVNKVMLAELNSKAADIAMVQANIAGAQGNLTLAQSAADRAVDLKYADAKDAVDVRLKQLELIQNELTKEEKVRSDAVTQYLTDQKNALAVQVANEKDKNATLLNLMQTYPDANITLQDTIESANRKITANSKIYQNADRIPQVR